MKKSITNKFLCFLIIILAISLSAITTLNLVGADTLSLYKNLLTKNNRMKVIVVLEDKSLLDYPQRDNYISALKNPLSKKDVLLDINKSRNKIITKQNSIKKILMKVCNNPEFSHSYTLAFNGIGINIDKKDLNKLKAIAGIKDVYICNKVMPQKTIHTNLSSIKPLIKSNSFKYKGDNIVVAIIDDGIDYTHKDLQMDKSIPVRISPNSIVGKGKYFTNKVPYGYNFYDNNQDIKSNSNHGTAVAGIIGATGDPSNGGLQGVAPNVQLLGLKVFPASGDGSDDDAILAAIEEAIYQKADIINLSLGFSNVSSYSKLYEKLADISEKLGIIVNLAAGNNGISVNLDYAPIVKDVGTMNNLIAGKNALIVGGCTDFNRTYNILSIKENSDELIHVPYELISLNKDFFGKFNLVTLNYKNNEYVIDFNTPSKIKDKILLLDTSSMPKENKIKNIINYIEKLYKNPLAILLLDSSRADMEKVSQIAKNTSFHDFPILFVNDKFHSELYEAINKGSEIIIPDKNNKIIYKEPAELYNNTSGGPDDFLNFKPHIIAPAQNVRTLKPSNNYTIVSGTSYATPYISGVSALILNRLIDEKYIKKSRSEFSRSLVNHNLVNNTELLFYNFKDTVGLLSFRLMGSGVVNIHDTLNADILISSDENLPYISLKQLNTNYRNFNIKIQNMTNNKKSLHIYPYKVLSSNNSWFLCTEEDDSFISLEKENITLNPKETITIKCKLNLNKSVLKGNFIEGLIGVDEISSNDKPISKGRIAFMGFYGDWQKLNVFDKLSNNKDSIFKLTNIYEQKNLSTDEYAPLEIRNDFIQLNSSELDNLVLYVSLLRDLSSFNASLYSSDKKINLSTFFKDTFNSKNYIKELPKFNNSSLILNNPTEGILIPANNLSPALKKLQSGKYYLRLVGIPHGYVDNPDYTQEMWLGIELK